MEEYTHHLPCSHLTRARLNKPIVAWCIGTCAKIYGGTEVQFGHAERLRTTSASSIDRLTPEERGTQSCAACIGTCAKIIPFEVHFGLIMQRCLRHRTAATSRLLTPRTLSLKGLTLSRAGVRVDAFGVVLARGVQPAAGSRFSITPRVWSCRLLRSLWTTSGRASWA